MKMVLNKWDFLQFEPFDAWRFDNEQNFLIYLWETLMSSGLASEATAALHRIHAVSNWLCLEISFTKKAKAWLLFLLQVCTEVAGVALILISSCFASGRGKCLFK